MSATKILAIDPGGKEIGVAVLQGTELLFYGVKTIRAPGTPSEVAKEARRIISGLIAEYQPDCLAIEQPLIVQHSARLLAVVIREIKHTARRRHLLLCEYAPKSVRRFICRTGKATKREVARRIAARYPELSRYLNYQNKWQEIYYAHVFDAVAVGLTCRYDRKSLGSLWHAQAVQ